MAERARNNPQGSVYDAPRHESAIEGRFPAAIRRISWGAIFAGVAVALVIQLLLNLFGLSIGLGTIDPATEQAPLQGIGTGTGIWLALSAIVALFAGGWVAGHLAGLPRRIDGLLHGFVTWAVTTFVTLYLITSGVGIVLGGALNVVQEGTQLLAEGVQAVAPEVAQQVEGDLSIEQVQQEAIEILRQTGREDLQPENLAERAQQAADTVGQAAREAAQQPGEAEEAIRQALRRLIAFGEETVTAADREAVVNVLVARTDMSRAEARQTVKEYEQAFQQAQQEVEQTTQELRQDAVQVADQAAATVSRAALWSALALVVGAVAAATGGAAGAPRDMPASPAVRRE